MSIYNKIANMYMKLDLGGGLRENIKLGNGRVLTILFGPDYSKLPDDTRAKINDFIEKIAEKKARKP